MNRPWAVRLEKTEVDSVEKLRLADGAEICEREHDIWVRGTTLDEPLARLLRRHPHARRHWILPDNQLVSPAKLVPQGHLPAGPWIPLGEWLTVCLPQSISGGRSTARAAMRLIRSEAVHEPNVLVTDIVQWADYCGDAPQVRLDCWFFAAAADGRVVVRGGPLPSLPGERFVEQQGIAVPAGWTWWPPVDTGVLREVLGIRDQDLAVMFVDNTLERIRGDQFVKTSRSAARVTAREFADGDSAV